MMQRIETLSHCERRKSLQKKRRVLPEAFTAVANGCADFDSFRPSKTRRYG
jgi:hypothetical protein